MSDVLLSPDLQALQGIRHGFFTRAWGNCGLSERFSAEEQAANRARVATHIGVASENLLSCYQIHSPAVVTVTAPWKGADRPQADAMVTNRRGIALGILTADCGPLLFADEKAGVIGAAHAGWRGALSGVIENTVAAMEQLGATRRNIRTALGACIWQNSYEVGADFPAPFLAEDADYEKLFRPSLKSGHYMFNLPAYIEAKLRKAGIVAPDMSPADTCADEARFFSYRRNTLRDISPTESLISVIALAG